MLYLYDPKYNLKTAMSNKQMSEISGLTEATLMSMRSKGRYYIRSLECYMVDDSTPLSLFRQYYRSVEYIGELWMIIDNTNEKYRVSNHGRIQKLYNKGWEFLLPYFKKREKTSNSKTHFIKIKFNDGTKEVSVHTLVAKYFIEENTRKDVCVYHKNGITYDNVWTNLGYITLKELGKKTGINTKKTESIVLIDHETLEVIEYYPSGRKAALDNFVSYQSVYDFLNGKYKVCADGLFFMKEKLYDELVEAGNLTKEYIVENNLYKYVS